MQSSDNFGIGHRVSEDDFIIPKQVGDTMKVLIVAKAVVGL